MADTPPRLDFIFQKYDPPLYFITFNTNRRRKLLTNDFVHQQLVEFAQQSEVRRIAVGRYVIMPEHIHLFLRNGGEYPLSQWVRQLKRKISSVIPASPPHCQKGFFDHLIRHGESYCEKWNYVQLNPVRAGLVTGPDDWRWQGEIVRIEAE